MPSWWLRRSSREQGSARQLPLFARARTSVPGPRSTPAGRSVTALQSILGGATQLPDGWPDPLTELDGKLSGSNSVYIGVHELPLGRPSFRPHPLFFAKQID